MWIERFRKAILEDVEHMLLPTHIDPVYRPGFMPSVNLPQGYGKNNIHPIGNIPLVMHHGGAPPQSWPPWNEYSTAARSTDWSTSKWISPQSWR